MPVYPAFITFDLSQFSQSSVDDTEAGPTLVFIFAVNTTPVVPFIIIWQAERHGTIF